MHPYPRSPDLDWPGHLHGSGCLSARAVGTGFPTVGLRLCLGPGCGWVWVLLTPASPGWGLGWVCLGTFCGVVSLLPAVCGVRGGALVSACLWDVCGFVRVSLASRFSGSGVRCGRACWAWVSAVPRPSWLGCRSVVFALLFFGFVVSVAGCSCPGPCGLSPFPLSFGVGCWLFFFVVCVCMFRCPFSWWAAVPGLVLPFLAGRPRCASLGVLSSVPSGWGVGPPFVLLAGGLVAVGCFRAPPPVFFFGGGACLFLSLPSLGWRTHCGRCVVRLVPHHSWRRFLCATPRHSWLGFAAGGGGRSSPLLAEGPGCGSPPLLAGVRWRRWCVVCGGGVLVGVWLVCGVVGPSPLLAEVPVCYSPPLLAGFRCRWWWAFLSPPGGGSRVRFPATPGWGPLAAVVCGVRRWCVGRVVAGVWCGWSLATPGRGSFVLVPDTPGWVSLPVVVGIPLPSWRRVPGAVPRHSWLGFAVGGGVWCVVCGVWCAVVVCSWGCGWCVVWLVPRHSWRRFLCAPPRHSWLGFAAGGGARSSPLLAEGPGRGSPPLRAGVRWRRWCVVCGVWRWCVGGVVAGVWCGWSLATPGGGSRVLLPATPGWVSLLVVVGVPRHSWLRVPGAVPRHSWLGSAGGGGVWCAAVVC